MDLLTYIIICPLVFLAGFVDAVAGGGGMIVCGCVRVGRHVRRGGDFPLFHCHK